MKNEKIIGHLAAVVCVLIWGTTFISTKILLTGFGSVVILHEPVTGLMILGTILTLAGLLISEIKPKENVNANEEKASEINTKNKENRRYV